MKTLVIGASTNPDRYSFKAIALLREYKHEVLALGKELGKVVDISFIQDFPKGEKIDTITLYINPKIQPDYYQEIIEAQPRRIIFNPGTENPELVRLANANNILTEDACTLVLLNTNQY
jgi:predicted CoA-binding protein